MLEFLQGSGGPRGRLLSSRPPKLLSHILVFVQRLLFPPPDAPLLQALKDPRMRHCHQYADTTLSTTRWCVAPPGALTDSFLLATWVTCPRFQIVLGIVMGWDPSLLWGIWPPVHHPGWVPSLMYSWRTVSVFLDVSGSWLVSGLWSSMKRTN